LSRFRNEDASADRGLGDVLRWVRTRAPKRWPRHVENRVRYERREPRPGEILITLINHSTFLIQAGPASSHRARAGAAGRSHATWALGAGRHGVNVLTDPVWSMRASPVQWAGPARVHAPGVPFDQLPAIDVVLVSHNHYDHMDLPTLRRLQTRFEPRLVTTLGNKAYLEARGFTRVTELGWWDSVAGRLPREDAADPLSDAADSQHPPIEIVATPAQHFSSRTLFDRNRTLWAGFVCTLAGRRVFFTGDSGYAAHFAAVGARLGALDAALVPIGAYEPRWFMSAAHMNPDEAVRAHLDLGSALSVAMHFGCFQLTDEAIDEPVRALEAARERHGVAASEFRVLQPGETVAIGG
jgi:L-ascorbate metabolism protein UlaG (beta-lactamase superfamily)